MSKRYDPKNKINFIENPEERARELFGYDDETLLRELKEAEMELEQMKAENPELEAQIAKETAAGFEALMQRIHDEGIKPVTEREYSEKKKEEERKVTRLRPVLKGMFAVAAVLVVLSGMGVVVSARNGFEYRHKNVGKVKTEDLWQNGEYESDVSSLENAYKKLHDSLGINVLALGYQPKDMTFVEILIDEEKGHATIVLQYNNNRIFLKETKSILNQVSGAVVSDRRKTEVIYNPWLECELLVEERLLKDQKIEYSTKLESNGAYYYFEGIMDKDEFLKIVKDLYYLQD